MGSSRTVAISRAGRREASRERVGRPEVVEGLQARGRWCGGRADRQNMLQVYAGRVARGLERAGCDGAGGRRGETRVEMWQSREAAVDVVCEEDRGWGERRVRVKGPDGFCEAVAASFGGEGKERSGFGCRRSRSSISRTGASPHPTTVRS